MFIERIGNTNFSDNDLLMLSHTGEIAFALHREGSYYIFTDPGVVFNDIRVESHFLQGRNFVKYNSLDNYTHCVNYKDCKKIKNFSKLRDILIEKVDFIEKGQSSAHKEGDILVSAKHEYYIYLGDKNYQIKFLVDHIKDETEQVTFIGSFSSSKHKYLQISSNALEFIKKEKIIEGHLKEKSFIENIIEVKAKKRFKQVVGNIAFDDLFSYKFKFDHYHGKLKTSGLDIKIEYDNYSSLNELLNDSLSYFLEQSEGEYSRPIIDVMLYDKQVED